MVRKLPSKVSKVWKEFENHLYNIGLTEKRREKLFVMFVTVTRFLDLEKAGRKEIEQYLNKLNRDAITRKNGKVYAGSTKADIKKFLKQYYKHTKGKDEFYPSEVSWINCKIAKDEKPEEKEILQQDQVIRLANSFTKPEYVILTLLLFDSGFRIQEMLSVKKKNLTWDTFDDDGNKCFWIECNKSKTDTRNIPIQLFTEDIKNFVNGSYYTSLEAEDILFNISYAGYLKMLKKHAAKLFDKRISPHCLRHSSATLYAKLLQGDMIAIANRFGWSYSSKELTTYVRKSKAFHNTAAKRVFNNDVIKLKEQVADMQEQINKLNTMMQKEYKAKKVRGKLTK